MIYTNNTFIGQWPVGTAAVVRADTPEEAAKLLQDVLAEQGLQQDVSPANMHVFVRLVTILSDGNY